MEVREATTYSEESMNKYKFSLNFAKIIKFPLDNTPKAKYTKGVFFIRF